MVAMIGVFVFSEITDMGSDGSVRYGKIQQDDGEIDRYQCCECGWEVPCEPNPESLYEYLLKVAAGIKIEEEEEEPVDSTPEFMRFLKAAKVAFLEGDGTENIVWVKTTADIADYFLNVLPPIYGNGMFACSEAERDNKAGFPVYLAFRKLNRKANTAEARYCTRVEIATGSPTR